MKSSKLPHKLAKNASKLHKHIGELLSGHNLFANYDIRQEYAVSKVNPTYKSNREKFDWVILQLRVIIEAHGRQHYEPVCFGGISEEQAKKNFLTQQDRDHLKAKAAKEAGWAYVIVKYDEKNIVAEELESRIKQAILNVKVEEGNAKLQELKATKPKAKIQSRGFSKDKKKHNWPKRKIPGRKFNGEPSDGSL